MLHFPTYLTIIGYAIFWIELYFFRNSSGQTSWSAPALAAALFIYIGYRTWPTWKDAWQKYREEFLLWPRTTAAVFIFISVLSAPIIFVSFYASLLPPHLLPEFDALNYHYTLPRQHLILHSFTHIPWSTADLFPFSIQSALAPYWFCTALPNKIPQLIFTLALWGLAFQITYRLAPQTRAFRAALLAIFAVIASHGFAIQYGTAMLDLVFCYFALAALDSAMTGRWALAGLEMSLWVGAKIPPLYMAVLCVTVIPALLWKWKIGTIGWSWSPCQMPGLQVLKRASVCFLIVAAVMSGPFMLKSMRYAGTPFFPLWTGAFHTVSPDAQSRLPLVQKAAADLWVVAHGGADDRSWKGVLTHPFLLAVPTKGVNNDFDYPLGLPYLIFVAPFAVFLLLAWRRRHLAVLPWLACVLWASWWRSSHQARFLYFPVLLIIVTVTAEECVTRAWAPRVALALSALLTSLSMVRGHRADFGKSRWEVLRAEDQALVRQGESFPSTPTTPVSVKDKEAAFATFPIHVATGDVFVLPETPAR